MSLFRLTASFTRPDNATAYAPDDEVSNDVDQADATPLVFPNAGSGYIVGARLSTSNHVVTNGVFALMLFSEMPTLVGDNAAYNVPDAQAASLIATIPVTLSASGGAGAGYGGGDIQPIPYVGGGAFASLFGVLVAKGAYTPAAQQTFAVNLFVERS